MILGKIADKIADKLEEALYKRWCQVCGQGRPLVPGAVQIRCSNCGVWSHCDNWDTQPPEKERHQ